MIKLVRCDDRLIHGQCVTQVIPMYGIKHVIAIDDMTASNPLLKKIFVSAAPTGTTVVVETYADAVPKIQEAVGNDVPTLVLIRVPELYEKLLAEVTGLPKDLNVASVPKGKEECVEVNTGTYFTPAQVASCKRMSEAGVHIWIQRIFSQPLVEWDHIKNKF